MARLPQGAAHPACGVTDSAQSQFGRRMDYGRVDHSTETLLPMIRSAFLFALACTLWANAARGQASDADLVTHIDHLEAEIRELTGTIEQLQFRNQQLQQEVQRLQAGAPAATPPKSAADATPPSHYTVIPQYTPPPPATYSPPPPGPVIA